MVKYKHCEECRSIYDTEPWIGEVHTYSGKCPSCMEEDQSGNQSPQKSLEDKVLDKFGTEQVEIIQDIHEHTRSTPIEIEKNLLSTMEQKANDVLSGMGSINVLIKEIKDDLVDKAKERIEETFQSFDANKIEAQKIVDYAESILVYLSEYKDYMDNIVKLIESKPKMKVKTAIDKVFKESMKNLPKDVAKDIFLERKAMLKTVSDKAVKCYNIYSDTKDVLELIKKIGLHPFNEIQKKLTTLPFYTSS
jgi:hypothetical protein